MATTLTEGQVFAGYRIEGVGGRGGMGVVYRARQISLERLVALKLIAPDLAQDPAFRDRFQRESRVLASVDHPNVIPVYEAGEVDGRLFISMRWVEGTDMREILAKTGRLDPMRAAQVVSQVAEALDAAHARGLVHRDVKPANVLIERRGDAPHAYLTDFGLTKQVGSSDRLTQTGQFVGTLDYVAPEQIEGKPVDARTDVYALGCVLFEILTGRVPYQRDTEPAKMWAHMSEAPPSPRTVAGDVPPAFDQIIQRALAKGPDDRYPSAGDLARAATAVAEGRPVWQTERSVAAGAAAPGRAPPAQPVVGATAAASLDRAPTAKPLVGAPSAPPAARSGAAAGVAGLLSTPPAAPHDGPPARRRRRNPIWIVAAALIGLALVGGGVALGLGGGDDEGDAGRRAGGAAAEITRVRLPATAIPGKIAANDDNAYVVDRPGGKLIVVDAAAARIQASLEVGDSPGDVIVNAPGLAERAWVALLGDKAVAEISETGRIVGGKPFDVQYAPSYLALNGGRLFVLSRTDKGSHVLAVDTKNQRDIGRPKESVGGPADIVATRAGGVAVLNNLGTMGIVTYDRNLRELRRILLELKGPGIKGRGQAAEMVVIDDVAWISWALGPDALSEPNASLDEKRPGAVTRVDLDTGRPVGRPIRVGRQPNDIAVDEDAGVVWVANSADSTVNRIDAKTGRPIGGPIKVPGGAETIAAAGGVAWVAGNRDAFRIRPND